jgi:hypothetical protein
VFDTIKASQATTTEVGDDSRIYDCLLCNMDKRFVVISFTVKTAFSSFTKSVDSASPTAKAAFFNVR